MTEINNGLQDQPVVDILMATYNGEKYLAEQVRSIQAQDYTNWRLFIRDDGSRDGTADVIRQLCDDKRVHAVFDDQGNLGVVKNFEKLLTISDAPYTAFSDQDDIWMPHKLSELVQVMTETEKGNPGLPVLVHADSSVTDSELKVVNERFIGARGNRRELPYLLFNSVVQGSTAMINRELRLMGLPIGDVYIHDRYLHMICEVFGKRVYIDKSSMLYRQHNDNVLGSGLYTKRNSLLTKIRKTFTGDYVLVDQRDRGLMEQFYKRFKERMPLSSRRIFEDYFAVTDDTTPGKLKKIMLLLKHRFAKPDLFIQLLFYRQKKGGKA